MGRDREVEFEEKARGKNRGMMEDIGNLKG
jgi:hypothetical protein